MLFTSLNFLLFFPTVIVLYYLLPKKLRWIFLLIVSLFFYANLQPVFSLLLVLVSLITYVFGLLIYNEKSDKKRHYLLILSVVLILSPLFFYKYYDFVSQGIFSILESTGLRLEFPEISLLLPIGISFYTFMALGYIVDVYNEEIKAEKNLGLITLFLSFFPLVLSGPIERAPSMLSQFKKNLKFDHQKAINGFQLMLWGYFMKLVIADRLGIYTNTVFSHIDDYSGSTLFLTTILYPIQVYADLGGYSLMAIGAANILGISIRPNFNRPFFATSMSEFWRKWHMSLITWITDYLYTPISFSLRKYKIWGIVCAIFITFIIAGIWHGAGIGFIFWGFFQGFLLSMEALTKNKKSKFEKKYGLNKKTWYILISILITYSLFAISLLFGVGIVTISEAFIILEKIDINFSEIYINKADLAYACIGICILFLSEFRDEYFPEKVLLFKNRNILIRWSAYFVILILIVLIGVFDGGEFIYFNF